MAARKYRLQSNSEVRPSWRMRLVQDDDAPVDSPALAMQQTLQRATTDSFEPYERYPLAYRVGFPILASCALWYVLLRIVQTLA